jgi:hypothetical protein
MNREDIKKNLQMLGLELQKKEVTGQILLADGVVMLLDVRKPKIRKDIDAYLKGDKTAIHIPNDIDSHFGGGGAIIREAAASIASSEGLPDNWLQDALKEFFFTQPPQEKWLEYPGLRVFLAPAAYVLAMKVAAPDCSQDIEDIKVLAGKLQVSTAQDMLALVKRYIPQELLMPEMRQRIRESFKPDKRPMGYTIGNG